MIRKLVLENFMTHRRTEITFSPGVTLIVGPNNCGKSAVVEALRCLKENDSLGKAFIRHGAKEAVVTVLTTEGDRIQWTRTAQSSIYKLNDRTFSRLGSTVHEDISKALKMPDIEGIDIHLSDQKHQIFLFDRKSGEIARFFASNSDVDLLNDMQRAHSRRTLEAKRDRESRLKDREVWSSRYGQLDALAEYEASVKSLVSTHDQLKESASLRLRLDSWLTDVEARRESADLAVAKSSALQTLPPPPKVHETSALRYLLAGVQGRRKAAEAATSRALVLQNLPPLPELHETHSLRQVQEKLKLLKGRARVTASLCGVTEGLGTPPKIAETRLLDQLMKGLQQAISSLNQTTLTHAAVNTLPPPPHLGSTEKLADALKRFRHWQNLQVKAKEHLAEITQERAEVRDALVSLIQDTRCPTCGAPLELERLVEVQDV